LDPLTEPDHLADTQRKHQRVLLSALRKIVMSSYDNVNHFSPLNLLVFQKDQAITKIISLSQTNTFLRLTLILINNY
jgi:hypothetical protein